jgi:hypothetical protein
MLNLQHILGIDIIGINSLTPTTRIDSITDSGNGVAGSGFSVATLTGHFQPGLGVFQGFCR